MFHQTILIGRLGRDPEMRFTPEGKAVTSFSVAVDEGYGEQKKTIWYKVTAWEKLAETCNNFLQKGKLVFVEGHLSEPRIWKDKTSGESKTGLEITATTVKFLSAKDEQ